MWPEPLQSLFARAASRLRLIALARGAAIAFALSLPLVIARIAGVLPTMAVVIASAIVVAIVCAISWLRTPQQPEVVAAAIESRTQVAKNLFVTAAEIGARQMPLRADVREVVFRDASDAASRIDVTTLFPAQRTVMFAAAAIALWIVGVSVDQRWIARARDIVSASVPGAPTIASVKITVTPPSYTGRAVQSFTDPERVDALAGSVIRVTVDASAEHVDLMGVGERHAMAKTSGGAFESDVTATADGFIAVQPFGAGEAAGVRRVMSLAVTPDRSPTAKITAPGKDLFLAAGKETLPVKIEASDDIGLRSLTLTYTKVTGSGENFQFKDGEFPLQISRDKATSWTAQSAIPLASLALEAGDVLVYRAVVADTLPGREPIESDAFVIQIIRPGEAIAEGFSMDEEKDKYAISQAMIILKTEKLIARKASITAEAFNDEAQNLAAEQKKVRAEFVFMMGGEFEDAGGAGGELHEEEEAANEGELMSGRMQNNGRNDIIMATRYMSNVVQLLTNFNAKDALPIEKKALDSLQKAFTKSRYILRVLAPRERIDDARRLSGKLTDAAAWRRNAPEIANDPRTAALLSALTNVGRVSGRTQYSAAEANELAGIAEAILRADSLLAPVAQAFTQASASAGASKPAAETSALIDAAAAKLSAAARRTLPAAPAATDSSNARVRGALADALKRGARK